MVSLYNFNYNSITGDHHNKLVWTGLFQYNSQWGKLVWEKLSLLE